MSFGFDLTKVETEANKRGALPKGDYTATIEKIERKSSKGNSENKYLSVMYKVCDMPSRNGAVFFDNVNIYNTSQEAQNIGRARLKAMLLSAGAQEDNISGLDESFLVGKKVVCTLGIESSADYGDRNRVFQVSPVQGKGEVSNADEDATRQAPSWL